MYLQDNLVTFLAEGLQEVCTKQPEDPVDALAEYLFKRSLDVRYPDPSQYWEEKASIWIPSVATKPLQKLLSFQFKQCIPLLIL